MAEELGRNFAEALGRKDGAQLMSLLRADVDGPELRDDALTTAP
jgi:hypothetical protein